MVFCDFMLPQFFGLRREEYMGPIVSKWWSYMNSEVKSACEVKEEITNVLLEWVKNGRFEPIAKELASWIENQ